MLCLRLRRTIQTIIAGWASTGIFSMSRLRIPMVMVVILLGHDPQAPCSFRYTTGPSISESSTLPPSDMRYGRICKQQDMISIDRHTFGPICVQQNTIKLVMFSVSSCLAVITSSRTASTFSVVSSKLSAVAVNTTARLPARNCT
jgi:hypothetical protein